MPKITEQRDVLASHVRAHTTDLSSPDPSVVYVIRRHGKPVMLLWPAGGLNDPGTQRVKLTWAIKARNAFAQTEAPVPEYPRTWPQTTLRRNATDIYLDIAVSPVPGLITHYGRNVAIYVPVRTDGEIQIWIETMNKLLE